LIEELPIESVYVKKMACGIKHTVLLSMEGEIIAFGGNEHGQCGDGKYGKDNMKRSFDPSLHLRGRLVKDIACGGAHSLFLTSNQEIFSCGLNDKG